MSNPNRLANTGTETIERLGLQGAMASFEGTPIIPLIMDSLTAAGISPYNYNPAQNQHVNYYGFPVDRLSPLHDSNLINPSVSPIIKTIEDRIEDRSITVRTLTDGEARFHPWKNVPKVGADYEPNAHLTAKLSTVGMLELTDAPTGQVLAYAPMLNFDGGRHGHALISVNDVIATPQEF